jgi:hypothetical protein
MTHIVCSSNKINVYRNVLNNTYKNRRIHHYDLKCCIKHIWTNVKFIDIVIQNNEFNLQICCDEDVEYNAKKYFDIVDNHRRNFNRFNKHDTDEEYSEFDVSFVKVARELNEWHIGTFILEKINVLSNGYDYDTDTDIDPNKSVIIPLGVPISRIIEFYGVRGV